MNAYGQPSEDVTVTTAVDELDGNGELDLDEYEADLPVIQLEVSQEGGLVDLEEGGATATTVDIVDQQQALVQHVAASNMPMASAVAAACSLSSTSKRFGHPEWIGVVLAASPRPTFRQLGLEITESPSSSAASDLLTAHTEYRPGSSYKLRSVNGKEDGLEHDFLEEKYGTLVFQADKADNVRAGLVQVLLSKKRPQDSFGLKIGSSASSGRKRITEIRDMASQSLLNRGDYVLAVNGIACDHNLSSQALAEIIAKSPKQVTILAQTTGNAAVVVVSEMVGGQEDDDSAKQVPPCDHMSNFTYIVLPVVLIAIAMLIIFVFIPMIILEDENDNTNTGSLLQDDGWDDGTDFDDLWDYHR